ncbi:MAG: hypothetical protein LBT59_13915 [Clostridiales bacterium]|jgi:hypothetical protein|nr:hypothetical protein [Clostridiales bacterium]
MKIFRGNAALYDERQLMIRSHVFSHMYFSLSVLTVLNAFLFSFDVEWASFWAATILLFVVSLVGGGMELLARGAFFQKNGTGWVLPYLIAGIGAFPLISFIIQIIGGLEFQSNGKLTDDAVLLIVDICLVAFGIFGIIRSRQMRHDWEKPDEE